MLTWIFILSFIRGAICAARTNVNVDGTTVGPNFVRPELKIGTQCPVEFPFTIGHGSHCCGTTKKINDPALHADCDGEDYSGFDSELCCGDGERIACPASPKGICKDNLNIDIDGGWTEWGPWTVEATRDYTSTEQTDPDALA